MAVKLADIARSVLAAVASDAGLELSGRWLNERYVEFCARTRLHQRRNIGQVYVPAPLTAGTVSATLGSPTVVGTSTAFSNLQVNNFFRYSVVWYRIIAVSGQTLTLDSNISEATNTAATYAVVQRYIPLDENARWVDQVVHQRRRRKLRDIPWARYQSTYPSRQLVGAYPWCWTEAPHYAGQHPTDATQRKQIEVYPPSTQAETYTYSYWSIPQTIQLEDYLPAEVDGYVLREGALIDHYRYQAEKMMQLRPADVNAAGYYANMASRQMAIWEDKIQHAVLSDSAGRQDVSLEWAAYGYADMGSDMDEDITNAHDQIIFGWTQ